MALAHGLWRMGRLAGGDAALLIALGSVFPAPGFLALLALAIAVLTLPRLAWKYRRDLTLALRMLVTAGSGPALGVMRSAVRARARPEPVAWVFATAGILAACMRCI